MKETELISFETAKLAKELGYDELCFHYFSMDGEAKVLREDGMYFLSRGQSGRLILRPTQSQLQSWLRDEKHIDCHVLPVRFTGHSEISYYTYAVKNIQPVGKQKYKFETWEQALEIGLQEALKLLCNG